MTEAIDYDDAILDHLSIPESVEILYREKIDPATIAADDVRDGFVWVMDYRLKYGEPPSREVIAAETGWSDFREPEVPVQYAIDKLRERFVRRELKRINTHMARGMADPIEAARTGFTELSKLRFENQPRGTSLTSKDKILERYHRYVKRGPGLSFGFDEIDEATGGMHKGELYFGIARPKRYKSWLYLMKPCHANLRAGHSSVIFTLELTEEEVHDRLLCMEAGVSWSGYKKLQLVDKELALLERAEERMQETDATVYVRQPDLRHRTVTELVEEAKLLPVDVVYIDQMSFIRPDDYRLPQYQQIGEICIQLKAATKNWPIMVMAQFNREAEKMEDMADLSKIGLSDYIGQTADLLLGLHSDQEMRESGLTQMGVLASRALDIKEKWLIKVDLSFNSNFRIVRG